MSAFKFKRFIKVETFLVKIIAKLDIKYRYDALPKKALVVNSLANNLLMDKLAELNDMLISILNKESDFMDMNHMVIKLAIVHKAVSNT